MGEEGEKSILNQYTLDSVDEMVQGGITGGITGGRATHPGGTCMDIVIGLMGPVPGVLEWCLTSQ